MLLGDSEEIEFNKNEYKDNEIAIDDDFGNVVYSSELVDDKIIISNGSGNVLFSSENSDSEIKGKYGDIIL